MTDDLAERVARLEQEVAEERDRRQELEQHVGDVEEELAEERRARERAEGERDDLRDRLEELEQHVGDVEEKGGKHRKHLQRQMTEVKDRLPDANPIPDGGEPTSPDLYEPETPLEQVVALPENVADQQLSENQERARFVARDVRDYTRACQAGWTLSSSDLRRVLNARDGSGHTETVRRVQAMLDDLGGDGTDVVERHGTRRIVFYDDLVDRLQDVASGSHAVVLGES